MILTLTRILVSLLVLDLMVIVHELGHFLTARFFGVRVKEFGVGFGPVLAKTVRKGILYSFRAIPFGGFVKLAGMEMALEGGGAEEDTGPGSCGAQPPWK